MYLTANIVADLRLAERFTMNDAHQIRHWLSKNASTSRLCEIFADHYMFHTPFDIFKKAWEMCVSVEEMANAIDQGAHNKRIADELRGSNEPTHPAEYYKQLSAHKFFTTNDRRKIVHDTIILDVMAWGDRFGYPYSEVQVYKIKSTDGVRNMFDRWLNADHTLAEFIDIARGLGDYAMLDSLKRHGLVVVPYGTSATAHATATYSAPGGVAHHTGGTVTINNGSSGSTQSHANSIAHHTGGTVTINNGFSSQSYFEECAFMAEEEEEDEVEPTLSHLLDQKSDTHFLLVCIEMKRCWKKWLESEGLTKGANAERFITSVEKKTKNYPSENPMFMVLTELTKAPKYRDMTRGEFIRSLQKIKSVKKVADEWADALASTFVDESEEDLDAQEYNIRVELRKLFVEHKIFRGHNVDERIEEVLDILTAKLGIFDVDDLPHMSENDLEKLDLNVNEKRKMKKLISTIQ